MSQPTVSIGFSPTTPAPPTGDQNTIPQSDNATPFQTESQYPQRATSLLFGTVRPIENEILIVTSGPTIPALAHAPNPASSLKLYWQGLRQRYTTDFTVSGTAITPVTFTPSVGDNLIADYRY